VTISGIEPFFDIHPVTGACFEVFYADRTLETFGRGGAGWFWWPRRRGFSPDGQATGPFATAYSAYRAAANGCEPPILFGRRSTTRLQTYAQPLNPQR
jgi:hypothetical protein